MNITVISLYYFVFLFFFGFKLKRRKINKNQQKCIIKNHNLRNIHERKENK